MYGREALRRLREQQAAPQQDRQVSLLAQIPLDAPMDDATITVWNGQRFVAYDHWLATAPLVLEENTEDVPKDATCLAGECGGVRICLAKEGERWLMYVGSRKRAARRPNFATPYLEHAIRTAEQWYGAPGRGWRAEKARDGRANETADLPAQDSTDEEGTGKRGDDDLDLGGR